MLHDSTKVRVVMCSLMICALSSMFPPVWAWADLNRQSFALPIKLHSHMAAFAAVVQIYVLWILQELMQDF